MLGEVNKQFVASPDVDILLQALEDADSAVAELPIEGEDALIKM